MRSGPITLNVTVEKYPLKEPFRITGQTMEVADVVTVTLERNGHQGWGEASGVYYRVDDDIPGMVRQIEAVRAQVEAGVSRQALQELLPTGGARNALDCALWDLEAKETGRPVWQIAGLDRPRALLTTFTVGANGAEKMAADARAYGQAKAIKLKLTGDPEDSDRVRAVRAARPDVWLGVDANQGFTRESLETLMPVLVDARVQLIEQPFKAGQEALLDGLRSPIPMAADESAQGLADLPGLVGRFQVINIKLDKCGGLTEGLLMARDSVSWWETWWARPWRWPPHSWSANCVKSSTWTGPSFCGPTGFIRFSMRMATSTVPTPCGERHELETNRPSDRLCVCCRQCGGGYAGGARRNRPGGHRKRRARGRNGWGFAQGKHPYRRRSDHRRGSI
jgi:L-Ala-D/L-Glu epimerase